jgi:Asp-tRNA(Asn)/Glu-tRNA(Gln) amidotransferase C subunit
MTDLAPDQVRALASAAGLALTDDDLAEITHRVNAFVEALGPLARLPLDGVEPLPVAPEPG